MLSVTVEAAIVDGEMIIVSLSLFSVLQLEFSPQTLCCYGKQLCTIPRDAAYFSYQNRYGGREGHAHLLKGEGSSGWMGQ